jgi:FG-GAP repeat
MSDGRRWMAKRLLPSVCCVAVVLLTVILVGCPNGILTSNPAAGDGTGGETTDEFGLLNLLSDIAFSDDIALTVLYSVPSNSGDVVAIYRVLSAPVSAGGVEIGVEETIAEGLPVGANQSFVFNTAGLRPGFYQVVVQAGGVSYPSQGTIEIQGPPSPLFIEPSSDLTVAAGATVNISADVGDPQGSAQWRLFYQDSDADLSQEGQAGGGALLGTRIAEGAGSTVTVSWDTQSIPLGTYRFGLSATDTGTSVADAVSAGRADSIVTAYSVAVVEVTPSAGASRRPRISITTSDLTAFGGETVVIDFDAQKFEGPDFVVTVYRVFDDVRTTIGTVTDPDVSSVNLDTTDLAAGVHEIGASISDGLNPLVEVADADRMRLTILAVADVELSVSAPGFDIRVPQGSMVSVNWSTNVPPADDRTVRVFARACTDCSAAASGTGADIPIADGLRLDGQSTTWDTAGLLGNHLVFAEMTLADQTPEIIVTERAGGVVRVSIVPTTVYVGTAELNAKRAGQGLEPVFARDGEVFRGVNFGDNAGTFLTTAGDYNNDGSDEIIVGSRFGKPFFLANQGIGLGEAYMIYGGARKNRIRNLNEVGAVDSTGEPLLEGITFTGIRTSDAAPTATDGLSAVCLVPDQDGDSLPELAFGVPFATSRGHTKRLLIDGDTVRRDTLEKENQFERGGVVFVSSRNSIFRNPPSGDDPNSAQAVIKLDLVGQVFRRDTVELFPDNEPDMRGCAGLFPIDGFNQGVDGTTGAVTCSATGTDGCFETFVGTQIGFARALADHAGVTCTPFTTPPPNSGALCGCFGSPGDPLPNALTNELGASDHLAPADAGTCGVSLGMTSGAFTVGDVTGTTPAAEMPNDTRLGSGFYPLGVEVEDDTEDPLNRPLEPIGARLIGNSPGTDGNEQATGDKFGSALAVSGGFVIISAPNRNPNVTVEVPSFPSAIPQPSTPGVMYLIRMNNLWPDPDVIPWDDPATTDMVEGIRPPLPFQYQIGPFPAQFDASAPIPTPTMRNAASHCGRDALMESFPSPFRILGGNGHQIAQVAGIPDFDLDGREDFVVGGPGAGGGAGAVSVLFRRQSTLEGDYVLDTIALAQSDPDRLRGALFNGRAGERLGEVMVKSMQVINANGSLSNQTIDFNGDGNDDLIIANPSANGDTGEIIIVFASRTLVTGQNGLNLDTLLAASDELGQPRAIRITGAATGDLFGFNAAVVGDFNGDEINDLLVAAPGASPMFDSDDDGIPDTAGIDVVNLADPTSAFGDGIADDVNLDLIPDTLTDAGQVYLIYGVANLPSLADATRTIAVSTLGTSVFGGVIFVGKEGSDALGHPGDALGGGESTRAGRTFRSFGIGPAGDVDGDGRQDILMGSILARPDGRTEAGEAYLFYGFSE